MTTILAIRRDIDAYVLVAGEMITETCSWHRTECRVLFGTMSTRPDPVQRAWGRLEAKWGDARTAGTPRAEGWRPAGNTERGGRWIRSPAAWAIKQAQRFNRNGVNSHG